MMTVQEMVRGLVRAAESKEQEDGGRIWDDECRRALEAARERGWGLHRFGSLVDTNNATRVGMEKLRELAERVMKLSVAPGEDPHPWELQTSNSFRRIGTSRGDGDVLCAITQRPDGHPDLHGAASVLDYIVAAQPRTVLVLLDLVDRLEHSIMEAMDGQIDQKEGLAQALLDFAEKSNRDILTLIENHVFAPMRHLEGAAAPPDCGHVEPMLFCERCRVAGRLLVPASDKDEAPR